MNSQGKYRKILKIGEGKILFLRKPFGGRSESMALRFQELVHSIKSLEKEVEELHNYKQKINSERAYTQAIQLSLDHEIKNIYNKIDSIMGRSSGYESIPWDNNPNSFSLIDVNPQKNRKGNLGIPNPSDDDVMNFIQDLPKTEIHLHIEACVNKKTLKYLYEKNGNPVSDEHIQEKFSFKDLNGFIQTFFFIQGSVKEAKDLGIMVESLRDYLKKNKIRYSEVFFAPTRFIQNGLKFEDMIDALIKIIQEIEKNDKIIIRILVDVSRSFGPDNAAKNLDFVLSNPRKEIIGIGLGGAELMGPAKDYGIVFQKAKKQGLHVVTHAGEDDGPWSIWDSIDICGAERIGHGISAIQDPKLLKAMKDRQIPIEICITSNIFTGKYVKKEENHPVRTYFDMGIPCVINTDDPEIFDVSLNYEYFKLYKYLNFTPNEIIKLIEQGVKASFYPKKEELWKEMNQEIQTIKKQYNLV
jgi:adenosine deaminase